MKGITAVVVDPGTLTDSRLLDHGVPASWGIITKYVINPLQPVLRFVMPFLRRSRAAGKELGHLSLGDAYKGTRGYFRLSNQVRSSAESYDEMKWARVWDKSVAWAEIDATETVLALTST